MVTKINIHLRVARMRYLLRTMMDRLKGRNFVPEALPKGIPFGNPSVLHCLRASSSYAQCPIDHRTMRQEKIKEIPKRPVSLVGFKGQSPLFTAGSSFISSVCRAFFFLLACGVVTTVFADRWTCKPPLVHHEDFNIYVAPQIQRVKFQVNDLAIFRGVMTGGSFGFEYRPIWWFYAGSTVSWMMGGCDARQQMSRDLHDVDAQIDFGYTFGIWSYSRISLTFFSGLGFEHIVQHIRPDEVLPSLKYRYYTYYIPVGAILDFRLSEKFGFRFSGEWKPTLNERLREPYLTGLSFDLKRKAGYEFEIPFNFYFGAGSTKGLFSIVPYLKRVVDGKLRAGTPSGAKVTLPEQEYKFWGMRLDFGIAF